MDLADGRVRLSALVGQRGSVDLGGHLLDGDCGGVVETGLGQADLESGVRRRGLNMMHHQGPATHQHTQQSTCGHRRHLDPNSDLRTSIHSSPC